MPNSHAQRNEPHLQIRRETLNSTQLTKAYPVSSRFILASILPPNSDDHNELCQVELNLKPELLVIKKLLKTKKADTTTPAQTEEKTNAIRKSCIDLFVTKLQHIPWPRDIKINYGELFYQHMFSHYIKPIKGIKDPVIFRGSDFIELIPFPNETDAAYIHEKATLCYNRLITYLISLETKMQGTELTIDQSKKITIAVCSELINLIKLNYQINSPPLSKGSDTHESVCNFIFNTFNGFLVKNKKDLGNLITLFNQAIYMAGISIKTNESTKKIELFTRNKKTDEALTSTDGLAEAVLSPDTSTYAGHHVLIHLFSKYRNPGTESYVESLKTNSNILQESSLQRMAQIMNEELSFDLLVETVFYLRKHLYALGLFQLAIEHKNAFLINKEQIINRLQEMEMFDFQLKNILNHGSMTPEGVIKTIVIFFFGRLNNWEMPLFTPTEPNASINPVAILSIEPKPWGSDINKELQLVLDRLQGDPLREAQIKSERNFLRAIISYQVFRKHKTPLKESIKKIKLFISIALVKYLSLTQLHYNQYELLSDKQIQQINSMLTDFTTQIDSIPINSAWFEKTIELLKKLTKSSADHMESETPANSVVVAAKAIAAKPIEAVAVATVTNETSIKAVKSNKKSYAELINEGLREHYGDQLQVTESGYELQLDHSYQLTLQTKGMANGFSLTANSITLACMPNRLHGEANPAYAKRIVELIDHSSGELQRVITSKAVTANQEPSNDVQTSMTYLHAWENHLDLCKQINSVEAELSSANKALQAETNRLFEHLTNELNKIQLNLKTSWKPETTILSQLESYQTLLRKAEKYLSTSQINQLKTTYKTSNELLEQQMITFLTTLHNEKKNSDAVYANFSKKSAYLLTFIAKQTAGTVLNLSVSKIFINSFQQYYKQTDNIRLFLSQLDTFIQSLPKDDCFQRTQKKLQPLLRQAQDKLKQSKTKTITAEVEQSEKTPAQTLSEQAPDNNGPLSVTTPAQTLSEQVRNNIETTHVNPAKELPNKVPPQALEYAAIEHKPPIELTATDLSKKIRCNQQDNGITSFNKLSTLVFHLKQSGFTLYLSGYAALDLTGFIESSWKHDDTDLVLLIDNEKYPALIVCLNNIQKQTGITFRLVNAFSPKDRSYNSYSFKDCNLGMELDITVIVSEKQAWTVSEYLQKSDHRSSYAGLTELNHVTTPENTRLVMTQTHRLIPTGSHLGDREILLGRAYLKLTAQSTSFAVSAFIHVLKCASKSGQIDQVLGLLSCIAATIAPSSYHFARNRLQSKLKPPHQEILASVGQKTRIPLLDGLFESAASKPNHATAIPH